MIYYLHLLEAGFRAEEELQARRVQGTLTSDHLYNLVLASTGDVEQAEKAEADFILATMKTKSGTESFGDES
jgi:hypothetical protein